MQHQQQDHNGAGNGSGVDDLLRRLDNMPQSSTSSAPIAISKGGASIDDHRGGRGGGIKVKRRSGTCRRTLTFLLPLAALALIADCLFSPPERRLLSAHRIQTFLLWVKTHPSTGAAAFVLVYGACVALLLPGTPLTLGGGYVYKAAYGWAGGVFLATTVSMAGSLFGSCLCFILGRYVMRERVRKWGRKYPLFDAIDMAVSDNGFKIMCLLYLTPILPLGPVSYMCGTTSMPLRNFAAAKIAALPLMLLYAFLGASTDTLVMSATSVSAGEAAVSGGGGGGEDNAAAEDAGARTMGVSDETHRKMVLYGLCLSVVSMTAVSHFVKKELYKIFDKQKKDKKDAGEKYRQLSPPSSIHRGSSFGSNAGEKTSSERLNGDDDAELVPSTTEDQNLQRRPRGGTADRAASFADEEMG